MCSYLRRCQVAETRVGALHRRLLDHAETGARFAVAHITRTDAVLPVVEAVGSITRKPSRLVELLGRIKDKRDAIIGI